MDVQPEITQSSSPVTLPDGPKSVEFDDVSFRYDEAAEDVLRHVSFTVPAGQTAAFVGASGIGKTTVCSLIARFYDATGGSVHIGGTDVRELSFESLRRTVGIVQQEVCLFNGTIRDNIRYGSPDASDEEVENEMKTIAEKYGMDLESIKKYLPASEVKEQVIREKVIKVVADSAVAVEPEEKAEEKSEDKAEEKKEDIE